MRTRATAFRKSCERRQSEHHAILDATVFRFYRFIFRQIETDFIARIHSASLAYGSPRQHIRTTTDILLLLSRYPLLDNFDRQNALRVWGITCHNLAGIFKGGPVN
jgi:hypothetical protein